MISNPRVLLYFLQPTKQSLRIRLYYISRKKRGYKSSKSQTSKWFRLSECSLLNFILPSLINTSAPFRRFHLFLISKWKMWINNWLSYRQSIIKTFSLLSAQSLSHCQSNLIPFTMCMFCIHPVVHTFCPSFKMKLRSVWNLAKLMIIFTGKSSTKAFQLKCTQQQESLF